MTSLGVSLANPGLPGFLVAVAIAAGLSAAVFAHASKHGSRHATAWGVGVFLLAAVFIPVYFVHHWLVRTSR